MNAHAAYENVANISFTETNNLNNANISWGSINGERTMMIEWMKKASVDGLLGKGAMMNGSVDGDRFKAKIELPIE